MKSPRGDAGSGLPSSPLAEAEGRQQGDATQGSRAHGGSRCFTPSDPEGAPERQAPRSKGPASAGRQGAWLVLCAPSPSCPPHPAPEVSWGLSFTFLPSPQGRAPS